MKAIVFFAIIGLILSSCGVPTKVKVVHAFPPIYPDYIGVTIPVNVSPLNFLMRDSTEKMIVTIKGINDSITINGNRKIEIPLKKWKKLLFAEQGRNLFVRVTAL